MQGAVLIKMSRSYMKSDRHFRYAMMTSTPRPFLWPPLQLTTRWEDMYSRPVLLGKRCGYHRPLANVRPAIPYTHALRAHLTPTQALSLHYDVTLTSVRAQSITYGHSQVVRPAMYTRTLRALSAPTHNEANQRSWLWCLENHPSHQHPVPLIAADLPHR